MSAVRTVGGIREPDTNANNNNNKKKKRFNKLARDPFWLKANLNWEE